MLALIVDDSRSSLAQLQHLISRAGTAETLACLDPDEALEAAEKRRFGLIIVDHVMPKTDGIALVRRLRTIPHHGQTPILMVTASDQIGVRLAALDAGANDVLQKSAHPLELQNKIRNFLAVADAVQVLDCRVNGLAVAVETAVNDCLAREAEMIFRLSKAVEFRDNDTGEHTLRVASYSRLIAERLGLEPRLCQHIFLAAPLHDIGKVAIPDTILLKPGRLTAEEIAVMRTHAEIGGRLLGGSSSEIMQLAAEIASDHHERWDGAGYPRGLTGEAIPLSARIVAVADVYDALSTERPYKRPLSPEAAIRHIESESGGHFDPQCVTAFVTAFRSMETEMLSHDSW